MTTVREYIRTTTTLNIDFMKNVTFKDDLVRVQGDLFRYAFKLTSDQEDAHDLLQDTTLKALDNELKFVNNTNFKGWMYTIMYNLFINNYRKTIRENTFVDHSENQYQLHAALVEGCDNTEYSYDLKEVRRIVNNLAVDYRRPFTMFVAGFKYREIADKLNLPIGTVKSRIYFTRQKLQTELKDYCD